MLCTSLSSSEPMWFSCQCQAGAREHQQLGRGCAGSTGGSGGLLALQSLPSTPFPSQGLLMHYLTPQPETHIYMRRMFCFFPPSFSEVLEEAAKGGSQCVCRQQLESWDLCFSLGCHGWL